MIISQGFNPETVYLSTFVGHCEQDETTDNISMSNISASDEDSDTMKNEKRPKKTKECEYSSKKRRKKASLYCSLHGENNSHNSREWKVLKARDT